MSKQDRKPVKWVSSAKRDLDAMPEDVKDVFDHAIDLAQAGGEHKDAEVMTGFSSAGVLAKSSCNLLERPKHQWGTSLAYDDC